MAKIYLKKVPDLHHKYDCDLCDLRNNNDLCHKVNSICNDENIYFKIINKPINSIQDLPKPGGKK